MGATNVIARVGCVGVEVMSLFGVQMRFRGEWVLDDGIRMVDVVESPILEGVVEGERGTVERV